MRNSTTFGHNVGMERSIFGSQTRVTGAFDSFATSELEARGHGKTQNCGVSHEPHALFSPEKARRHQLFLPLWRIQGMFIIVEFHVPGQIWVLLLLKQKARAANEYSTQYPSYAESPSSSLNKIFIYVTSAENR